MINEEKYLFTLVQEECAEISQVAAKIIRFGLNNVAPGTEKDNLERLREEFVDLMGVLHMLRESLNIEVVDNDYEEFVAKCSTKVVKIKKYMEYSRERGELQ